MKENITNPDGPILTLIRTGKPARTAIEKALLTGTNLKPNDITKATNETEAALREAMETMRIKDAARQQAVKALEEKKYKEAQDAADRAAFLAQLKTESVTRQNFLSNLDQRIVFPISAEVNNLLTSFEQARFLTEDTDRFRKQLEVEAAKPITTIGNVEALTIADIVYKFSARRKSELDLLKIAIEQRNTPIPTYEPAPTIDFLANRQQDISAPVHEYVAGLLQDFEENQQAARRNDQESTQQNNLQWLNLGETIVNTPAQQQVDTQYDTSEIKKR